MKGFPQIRGARRHMIFSEGERMPSSRAAALTTNFAVDPGVYASLKAIWGFQRARMRPVRGSETMIAPAFPCISRLTTACKPSAARRSIPRREQKAEGLNYLLIFGGELLWRFAASPFNVAY